MALSRFNKFLVLKGYAIQEDLDSWKIVMKQMIDIKKVTKEFKDNDKNLKAYYAMKSKWETSWFKFHNIKSNLIFC